MPGLNYPVLKITKKFIRGSISSPKELLVVGEKNFVHGCFDNACIIDASGCKYRVLSAEKGRRTCSLFNLFKKYRTIWVCVKLSEPEKYNVDRLREQVLGLLCSHPGWYKHYGETEDSLRSKFSGARTVKELINSISIYP